MEFEFKVAGATIHTTLTQNEAGHGVEVASPTAKVEEAQTRREAQGLQYLGVYARRRQVYVAVFPREVFVRAVSMVFEVVVATVDRSEHLLDYRRLDVFCLDEITDQLFIVLTGTHGSSHSLH